MNIFTVIGVLIGVMILMSIFIIKTLLHIKELIIWNDNCIDSKIERTYSRIAKIDSDVENIKENLPLL